MLGQAFFLYASKEGWSVRQLHYTISLLAQIVYSVYGVQAMLCCCPQYKAPLQKERLHYTHQAPNNSSSIVCQIPWTLGGSSETHDQEKPLFSVDCTKIYSSMYYSEQNCIGLQVFSKCLNAIGLDHISRYRLFFYEVKPGLKIQKMLLGKPWLILAF